MGNKTRNTGNLVSENNIFVDIANDRVGIGSTQPTSTLNVAGIVSATSFEGDGSNLTGIANTAFINAEQVNVVGVVTATSASLSSASIASGHITLNNNGAKVIGVVTATSFDGDGSALTGISAGITTGKAIAMTMILG